MALTNLDLTLPGLGSSPGELVAENKYLYPSFELPSGTVTVRTNTVLTPIISASFSNWVANASWTHAAVAGGREFTAVSNVGLDAAIMGNAGGVTPGEPSCVAIEVANTGAVAVTLRSVQVFYTNANYTGTATIVRGDSVTINPGQTKVLTAATTVPASNLSVRAGLVSPGGSAVPSGSKFVVKDGASREVGVGPAERFTGNTPDAGDFEYVWSGTENASTSIMQAKGLLGVPDDGVYQSQEWAAEGTHSAFVPTGKKLAVALANPSTVKVIARSAGQTLVGSTGAEVARSYAFNPNALVSPGGYGVVASGGTGATVSSTAYETSGGPLTGEVDTYAKCTLTALTSGSALINWTVGSASTTGRYFAVTQGEVWTIQVRVRRTDKTGNVQVGIVEYSSTPAYLQDNMASATSVTAGVWTYISKSVTVTNASAARAMVKVYFSQTDTSSVGDEFGISAIVVTKTASAPLSGMFFSGSSLPSASGYPVWAGTPNASETIVYGVTSDTATSAGQTLEVEATGHVALLGGYWDALTIVPGVYTGPVFSGSSNYTGYSAVWNGTPDESTSTLSYAPLASPLGDIVSWSITEPTTPHNIHRRNGSTGTASVTAKAREDTYWTISEDTNITVEGLQGTFVGTINQSQISPFQEHGEPSGGVTFSIESVLNQLNAERTLAPVVNELLSDVVATYVAAVAPAMTVTWLASTNPTKTYSAWSGNVWDILKALCAANNIEMALNGSTLLIRDLGTNIVRLDSRENQGFDVENVSLSITPGSGQFVEITYRDSVAIDNQASYNYVDNPSVEINATGYGVRTTAFGAISGSRVTN